MATPENPNDDQPKIPVAELQQKAKKATPVYFTLLIYLSVLILAILTAIALIDNPSDRPDEAGPAESDTPVPAEHNSSLDAQLNSEPSISVVPVHLFQKEFATG